ncbi:orotidine-5'-phosphate decarboxylase [Syntrophaceticus schinkii]|jgi:orotidine-5'-phosphate decarboxylase|uniref:Orotidine 5'-phosphate decarboxylase n=1 Tax=Syntrophaceticus schinkii TaxID=499207 RepID=A0A0B7MMC7_9FIRM|nr:orotidine-5'-phosphate decarboxylase [Syntrophaceticus schinkii]MDD2359242.1 orotidine-5'-phosphate decarboxylase [Syntrophaceticus schinkii]MDD4261066.1 orotidine-5'-phosphate decarboxylase [Syntrophaceticus schinkii]CEO89393.1 Orotidine 5'-phosphate decarboxylase [Syntrophaceticus schinkii]
MQIKDRLIVALDVTEREKALELVEMLHDCCGMFKIGLEPFCIFGPTFVEEIQDRGGKVFLDLKFHDIPRTVAQAGRAAARLGVEMFNVHIAGGSEMMKAVVEAVREETAGKKQAKILGVTVLTSLGADELTRDLGIDRSPLEQVIFWAQEAKECGLSGVVASPREISAIREHCGRDFLIVTPGIRPAGFESGDQKRISTPGDAVRSGVDYIVVGRPILQAQDPRQAALDIVREMEEAIR